MYEGADAFLNLEVQIAIQSFGAHLEYEVLNSIDVGANAKVNGQVSVADEQKSDEFRPEKVKSHAHTYHGNPSVC